MSEEIKPVAVIKHEFGVAPIHLPDVTKLYAIPVTHRIVPVEMLERVQKFATVAAEHYSGMNDEVCQSYSESWQHGVAVCAELQAIIDKEPT